MKERYSDDLFTHGLPPHSPDSSSGMPIRFNRPSHCNESLGYPPLWISDADLGTDDIAICGSWQEPSLYFSPASRHGLELQHSFGNGHGLTPPGTSVDTYSDTAWSSTLYPAPENLKYGDEEVLDQSRIYSWGDVSHAMSMPTSASSVGSISGAYLFTSPMLGNRDVGSSDHSSFEPYMPTEQQFSVLQLPMPYRWDFTKNDVLDFSGFTSAQSCKSNIYSESLESESTIECGLSSHSLKKYRDRELRISHSRAHVAKSVCPEPGCGKDFSYSADLGRHVKTMHSDSGTGYRCTFEGCNKAYKIWHRLDSFKKHTRTQHPSDGAADVKGVVRKSRTNQHDLSVSVTTPEMIRKRGSRPRARASNPRFRPQ
jgi:hypothetical protein